LHGAVASRLHRGGSICARRTRAGAGQASPRPHKRRLHPRRGTCTARRRRSLSKRPSSRPKARRPSSANRGARGTTGARKAPNPWYTRVEQRNGPPTRGAHRPKTGSSTRAGRRGTATPAMSSTLDGRAKRRRGRRQATTLSGVDATIAMRIAHRCRSPREPVCSAGRSAR
jgi:hypothetical protein